MHAATLMFEISREAEDSFSQVVRERGPQLLRIAYRILGNWADAEDVAQEVFLRLHRHGMKFPNEGVLNAWLYRVTVNTCIDRRRRRRETDELPETHATDASAEMELLRMEQRQLLTIALASRLLKSGLLRAALQRKASGSVLRALNTKLSVGFCGLWTSAKASEGLCGHTSPYTLSA